MNKGDQRVRVRLTDYSGSWGVKTEIDGVELPDVTDLQFTSRPDEIATLVVGMLVSQPLDIEVSAKVIINLVVEEGCEVVDIATPGDEGNRRLIVRKPDA